MQLRQNQTEQNSRPNQSKNKSTQKADKSFKKRQIMGSSSFSTPKTIIVIDRYIDFLTDIYVSRHV